LSNFFSCKRHCKNKTSQENVGNSTGAFQDIFWKIIPFFLHDFWGIFCLFFLFFLIIIFLLYWGYIVTFAKVLTVYHSWIYLLHHSPLSPSPYSWNCFNRSHFSIFIYEYIKCSPHSPSFIFPYIGHFPSFLIYPFINYSLVIFFSQNLYYSLVGKDYFIWYKCSTLSRYNVCCSITENAFQIYMSFFLSVAIYMR
jgi:hypothetical protein